MASLDANFSGEIFRKDHPMVIAQNRHLATLMPIRVDYSATDLVAGTVMGRNTVNGHYGEYDNSASSGLDTAACVLFQTIATEDFDSSTGSTMAVGIFGGELFKDKLVGLDANAITDLDAKTIVDATNVNILKF